ncbi:MAG: imidazole glycerol phosphate synthase subunit HisH [Thermodesulfobacteriota bacterium]
MIAIIDYDAGNLASVERAVRHLGRPCTVTRNLSAIANAERIIFPGVGAAGSAMASLRKYGLDQALFRAMEEGKPILGICLGTQIVLSQSEENRATCLGLVPGMVKAFPVTMRENGERLKVPQMGWNNIRIQKPHPVLSGVRPEHQFYFVHGYYPAPKTAEDIYAETGYGLTFASVIGRKNLVATQFHPEKSGKPGLRILDNFCGWKP